MFWSAELLSPKYSEVPVPVKHIENSENGLFQAISWALVMITLQLNLYNKVRKCIMHGILKSYIYIGTGTIYKEFYNNIATC